MIFYCLQTKIFVFFESLLLLRIVEIASESVQGFVLAFNLNFLLEKSKSIPSFN